MHIQHAHMPTCPHAHVDTRTPEPVFALAHSRQPTYLVTESTHLTRMREGGDGAADAATADLSAADVGVTAVGVASRCSSSCSVRRLFCTNELLCRVGVLRSAAQRHISRGCAGWRIDTALCERYVGSSAVTTWFLHQHCDRRCARPPCIRLPTDSNVPHSAVRGRF
jgi:hypothetical protein